MEKQQRLEQAIEQLPELERKQAEAEKRAGQGVYGQKVRERQPRVSSTDPEARRMKLPHGGFNPAVNVQLAPTALVKKVVFDEVQRFPTNSTMQSRACVKLEKVRTEDVHGGCGIGRECS